MRMPESLKTYYNSELQAYEFYLKRNDLANAWRALERSHIIGQAFFWQHTRSHWMMFKFGWHIKDTKEILGQIPRLLVGGIKSFVGIIPLGNTGGAKVSPFRPMDIPEDLSLILKTHQK
ncbi:DUF3703 domain-containing protein [Gramella sp. BOM4]|nr:DUF3703 domain-containing protein [Christiangramia bathymodioli]